MSDKTPEFQKSKNLIEISVFGSVTKIFRRIAELDQNWMDQIDRIDNFNRLYFHNGSMGVMTELDRLRPVRRNPNFEWGEIIWPCFA